MGFRTQFQISFEQVNIKEEIIFAFLDIKVWMLTGDKMETAENIAISCKLFTEDMKRLYIHKKSLQDLLLLHDE